METTLSAKSSANKIANNALKILALSVQQDIKMMVTVVVKLILAAIQVVNFVLKEPTETMEIIIVFNVLITVLLVTVQLATLASMDSIKTLVSVSNVHNNARHVIMRNLA